MSGGKEGEEEPATVWGARQAGQIGGREKPSRSDSKLPEVTKRPGGALDT